MPANFTKYFPPPPPFGLECSKVTVAGRKTGCKDGKPREKGEMAWLTSPVHPFCFEDGVPYPVILGDWDNSESNREPAWRVADCNLEIQDWFPTPPRALWASHSSCTAVLSNCSYAKGPFSHLVPTLRRYCQWKSVGFFPMKLLALWKDISVLPKFDDMEEHGNLTWFKKIFLECAPAAFCFQVHNPPLLLVTAGLGSTYCKDDSFLSMFWNIHFMESSP